MLINLCFWLAERWCRRHFPSGAPAAVQTRASLVPDCQVTGSVSLPGPSCGKQGSIPKCLAPSGSQYLPPFTMLPLVHACVIKLLIISTSLSQTVTCHRWFFVSMAVSVFTVQTTWSNCRMCDVSPTFSVAIEDRAKCPVVLKFGSILY